MQELEARLAAEREHNAELERRRAELERQEAEEQRQLARRVKEQAKLQRRREREQEHQEAAAAAAVAAAPAAAAGVADQPDRVAAAAAAAAAVPSEEQPGHAAALPIASGGLAAEPAATCTLAPPAVPTQPAAKPEEGGHEDALLHELFPSLAPVLAAAAPQPSLAQLPSVGGLPFPLPLGPPPPQQPAAAPWPAAMQNEEQQPAPRPADVLSEEQQPAAEGSEQEDSCILCWAAPRETTLAPCGHRALCERCTRTLLQASHPCPVCRAKVGAIAHRCCVRGCTCLRLLEMVGVGSRRCRRRLPPLLQCSAIRSLLLLWDGWPSAKWVVSGIHAALRCAAQVESFIMREYWA